MARVWFCGFETGNIAETAGSHGGGLLVQGTTVRSGGYALKCAAGAVGWVESKIGLNLSTAFARAYVFIGSFPSNEADFLSFGYSADDYLTRLNLTTSGTVKAINVTGATLGTGAAVLNINAWNLIEMKTVISAGSGIVEVKINGVIDQTYTGLTNNAHGNVDRLIIGFASGVNPGIDEYFDDISIDDTAYCGPAQIIARQPKTGGTPTYDQYTKSTGTDAGAIWDDTEYTVADYCSDATSGHAQTAVISLFSATQSGHGTETVGASDTVNACKTWLIGKTSATTSGGQLASIRCRVNGVDTDTAISLTTVDAYYDAMFTTTVANLGLLEVGAVHGASTITHIIEDVGVIVEYTPAVNAYGWDAALWDVGKWDATAAAYTATGTLQAQSSHITGAAQSKGGTTKGVLAAQAAHITGAAQEQSLSTKGALVAQSAHITGAAQSKSVTTKGVLNAQAAHTVGAVQGKGVTTKGILAAQAAHTTGAAQGKGVTTKGVLTAQSAHVTGSANVLLANAGALVARAAHTAGAAVSSSSTTKGVLNTQAAHTASTGAGSSVTTRGVMNVQAAHITGAASAVTLTVSAQGALLARPAAAAGLAQVSATVPVSSGALLAAPSQVFGVAQVSGGVEPIPIVPPGVLNFGVRVYVPRRW